MLCRFLLDLCRTKDVDVPSDKAFGKSSIRHFVHTGVCVIWWPCSCWGLLLIYKIRIFFAEYCHRLHCESGQDCFYWKMPKLAFQNYSLLEPYFLFRYYYSGAFFFVVQNTLRSSRISILILFTHPMLSLMHSKAHDLRKTILSFSICTQSELLCSMLSEMDFPEKQLLKDFGLKLLYYKQAHFCQTM